ncbi:hypothetical protein FPRO05_08856 [Fusarium proliferatum]|uniref:DUF4139 domain-containing protein n=1 Tax=Gibberella intermedia TaxID=948311 RepID=A0A365NHW6_GIBIN|nr:hypothetical protein FPRO05_08856 [Fusarium proliferatum]
MGLAAPAFDTDVGHKVEYKIRDIGTRSVTLFPTQAQVKREIKDVPLKQRAREIIGNADERIKVLDIYSKSLDKREGVNIREMLDTYKQEHQKAFEERLVGVQRERELTETISKVTKEQMRLNKLGSKFQKKEAKNKARIQKAVQKKQEQRQKRQEEKRKEKERIRNERSRCWPLFCYTIHIQLEVSSSYTPASSRRESVSSEVELVQRPRSKTADLEETSSCNLVLSYVTNSAFWTPSYDIQLSTVDSTGTLCFDAGLHNTTSETWENCKITLSTSQATSSSLDESIPNLTPWHIKLGNRKSPSGETGAFESVVELQQQAAWRNKKQGPQQPPNFRREMFGLPGQALNDYQLQLMMLEQQNKKRLMMARQEQDSMAPPAPHTFPPPPPPVPTATMMQQQAQAQAQAHASQMRPPQSLGMMTMNHVAQSQQIQQQQQQFPGMSQMDFSSNFDFDAFLGEDTTMTDAQPSLEFQNSLVEETGFTTIFDLPGLKTLVPKFTVSKQRVARLQFTNVLFSHTIVAKYQPVAYLKAKLKNNSKLTLLRGPASLTLDGSFMGQSKIPRCSSGEVFTLSLGVDSAIRVIYPKPDVRRSTTGVFSKEDSSVYVRAVTVHNTRVTAKKPIGLLVLDQIPVSEDDRLRVELLSPRGLTVEGPRQATGTPGRETAEDKDWGKAMASLKKSGQVSWEVSLNAGKAVKLELEYSVSMPSGDVAKEC